MSPAYLEGNADNGVPPELLELSKLPNPGPGRRPFGNEDEGGGRKYGSPGELLGGSDEVSGFISD
jgi:hypothetical protein